MKSFFILFLLFPISLSAFNKAIVKASILRGESFVTVNLDPEKIENIVRNNLIEKGIEVVDKVTPGAEL